MNEFELNGKVYNHLLYTRAMEVDGGILVSNAPHSISNNVLEDMVLKAIVVFPSFEGHPNYDTKTGKWYDNNGELDVEGVDMTSPAYDFDYKLFTSLSDFEEECA